MLSEHTCTIGRLIVRINCTYHERNRKFIVDDRVAEATIKYAVGCTHESTGVPRAGSLCCVARRDNTLARPEQNEWTNAGGLDQSAAQVTTCGGNDFLTRYLRVPEDRPHLPVMKRIQRVPKRCDYSPAVTRSPFCSNVLCCA